MNQQEWNRVCTVMLKGFLVHLNASFICLLYGRVLCKEFLEFLGVLHGVQCDVLDKGMVGVLVSAKFCQLQTRNATKRGGNCCGTYRQAAGMTNGAGLRCHYLVLDSTGEGACKVTGSQVGT